VRDNDTLHDQNTGALDGCSGTTLDAAALPPVAASGLILTGASNDPVLSERLRTRFNNLSNARGDQALLEFDGATAS
jgi:hypothetical protein